HVEALLGCQTSGTEIYHGVFRKTIVCPEIKRLHICGGVTPIVNNLYKSGSEPAIGIILLLDRSGIGNYPVDHLCKDVFVLELPANRSEEHTSELQSRENLVCR